MEKEKKSDEEIEDIWGREGKEKKLGENGEKNDGKRGRGRGVCREGEEIW